MTRGAGAQVAPSGFSTMPGNLTGGAAMRAEKAMLLPSGDHCNFEGVVMPLVSGVPIVTSAKADQFGRLHRINAQPRGDIGNRGQQHG